jgi:hypothetical protein
MCINHYLQTLVDMITNKCPSIISFSLHAEALQCLVQAFYEGTLLQLEPFLQFSFDGIDL